MKDLFFKILKSDAYWRSAIRLAFLFLIVICLLEFAFKCKFSFECFDEGIIQRGMLFNYLRTRILLGLVYGLVMSFIFQRRKIKETQK